MLHHFYTFAEDVIAMRDLFVCDAIFYQQWLTDGLLSSKLPVRSAFSYHSYPAKRQNFQGWWRGGPPPSPHKAPPNPHKAPPWLSVGNLAAVASHTLSQHLISGTAADAYNRCIAHCLPES